MGQQHNAWGDVQATVNQDATQDVAQDAAQGCGTGFWNVTFGGRREAMGCEGGALEVTTD